MQGILIHMPREHYDSYAELICTVYEANGLLDTAEHVYPKVALRIKDAIAGPHYL